MNPRFRHRSRVQPSGYAFLLFLQLLDRMASLGVRPPVTISIIILNLFIFAVPILRPFAPPGISPYLARLHAWTSPSHACLIPQKVLDGERWRLIVPAFVHGSDLHVLYNCISFLYKGVTLEYVMGSVYFLALIVYLSFAPLVIYVGVAFLARELDIAPQMMSNRVVGFSGAIFGLKVILNSDPRCAQAARRIFGVSVPGGRGVWLELVLAQMAGPRVSFLGHLSGILAGMIYVYVPKMISKRISAPRHRD